jgi:hypothetical protein
MGVRFRRATSVEVVAAMHSRGVLRPEHIFRIYEMGEFLLAPLDTPNQLERQDEIRLFLHAIRHMKMPVGRVERTQNQPKSSRLATRRGFAQTPRLREPRPSAILAALIVSSA